MPLQVKFKRGDEDIMWSEAFFRAAKFYLCCLIVALAFYHFTRLAEKDAFARGKQYAYQDWFGHKASNPEEAKEAFPLNKEKKIDG